MKVTITFIKHILECFPHVWPLFAGFLLLFVIGAYLFHIFENMDFASALYLTFTTALTIGYGDITPATAAGRVTSVFLGILGLFVIGLVVGISARALILSMHPDKE